MLEPIFADQARIKGGAAGRHRNPVDFCEIERQRGGQPDSRCGEIDVMGERVGDHLGLLEDFLRHEMAVIALVDQEGRSRGADDRPRHHFAGGVLNHHAAASDHGKITILKVGERFGQWRERDGVGAEKHLAVAVADRERRAAAGADHEIVLAGK